MSLFTRGDFGNPQEDDAGVFIDGLGRALVIWTAMQDRTLVTVAEAALAFNTLPAVIAEAVEDAAWIEIANPREPDPCKQHLELDGE